MAKKKSRLAERAMVVDLTISLWEGRRKDKSITEEVTLEKHAEGDTGAWWTRAIPKRMLRGLRAARLEGRKVHWKYTLPWNNDGGRILPAATYMQYRAEMRKVRTKFDQAVEVFLQENPEVVARSKDRLGKLHDEGLFPHVSEIRAKFQWSVSIFNMPNAKDFRVEIGDEESREIRRNIEQSVKAKTEKIMGDLWGRLHKAIGRIAERLSNKDKIFRDSLLGNVRELCTLLPHLNVTGDRDLERMRREIIRGLGKRKPSEIRDNPTERKAAKKSADDILKRIKGFMGEEG